MGRYHELKEALKNKNLDVFDKVWQRLTPKERKIKVHETDVDNYDYTFLHYLCEIKFDQEENRAFNLLKDMVEKYEADLNRTTYLREGIDHQGKIFLHGEGNRPLHLAIVNQKTEIAVYIINHPEVKLHLCSFLGLSYIYSASWGFYKHSFEFTDKGMPEGEEISQKRLTHFKEIYTLLREKSPLTKEICSPVYVPKGESLIHVAVRYGKLDFLKEIISYMPDFKEILAKLKDNISPVDLLSYALVKCCDNQEVIYEYLVDQLKFSVPKNYQLLLESNKYLTDEQETFFSNYFSNKLQGDIQEPD